MKKISTFLKFFLSFLVTAFIVLSFFYYNDRSYNSALDSSKDNYYLSEILNLTDNFYNEVDIYKFFIRNNLEENNIIKLQLSGSDVKMINEQIELFKDVGYIKDELNAWRKGKIIIDKVEQDIKFKFHGTSISPITNFNAFSLRLKHKKEDMYLDYMREFSLLTSKDDLDISTISINKIAEDFGLLAPNGRMVIAEINNVPIGMFMLVEHTSKEWFERTHQMTNYTLLKSNDDWDRKENSSGTAHISNSDNTVNNKEVKTSSMRSEDALGALDELFQAIKNKNLERIKELVDLDYAARFLALHALANNAHSVIGDNLKYVYDHTSGKFKFLYRIEDTLKPLTNSITDFNLSWFISYFVGTQNLDLFKILIMDQDFRYARDNYLMKLVLKKDEILSNAESVFESNYQVLINSNLSLRRETAKKKLYLKSLENNLDVIKNYLDYNKVFVSIDSTKKNQTQLSVLNDSYIPIKLENILTNKGTQENLDLQPINDFNPVIFKAPNLNSFLEQKISINTLSLNTNQNIDGLEFVNEVTGSQIQKKDLYINYVSKVVNLSDAELINNLKVNNLIFSIKEDTIFIDKGVFKITKDLIFPKSKKVVFQPGVQFLLAPGVSILLQSDLKAIGDKADPIIIGPLDEDKSFGIFGVIGRQKKANVLLKDFQISGGNQSTINGIQFLGQLSIHNANVEIKDSYIAASSSDDGMNIRNSNVLIHNSIFEDNFADQIDLDFCKGELINNTFRFVSQPRNDLKDPNGDGLDVSGSKVILRKNSFEGFLDKALSVGEESVVLIENNIFNKNLRALTVKDGSKAYVLENYFRDNTFDFSLYIKKRLYKEPQIYIHNFPSSSKIDNQLARRINSFSVLSESEIIKSYEAE